MLLKQESYLTGPQMAYGSNITSYLYNIRFLIMLNINKKYLDFDERIIGGQDAGKGEFPYQVYLTK